MPAKLDTKTKIGVIGVSQSELKYGNRIFRDLANSGLENIWGVNPKGGKVADIELFKSVRELPEGLDVLICVVPAEVTLTLLADIAARRPKLIWLQPGAESVELVAAIAGEGIAYSQGVCFMTEHCIW